VSPPVDVDLTEQDGAGMPPMEPALGAMPPGEPTVQVTKVGLPRRVPKASLAPGLATQGTAPAAESGAATGMRTPEQVRSMLSSYRTGIERGRQSSSSEGGASPSEDDTLVGGDAPPFPSRGRRGGQ